MKKLLFIAAMALIYTGCKGPAGKDGRDGEGVNWYTTEITVYEHEWELKGNPGDLNSYFFASKYVGALNRNIYNRGSVIAYIEVEPGIKNGMPYVLHLGEEQNGEEFLWTQTYDFDFDYQSVGFYVTYSDFTTQIKPGTETFHLVIMW